MNLKNPVELITREITKLTNAEKIILFGSKKDVVSGQIKDIDICVVCEAPDKSGLENTLYLTIDSEISFDIIIYTPDEWTALTADRQSFAYRILEKGILVYEREEK
ncbi:MAG: nucleotidyltransferase domain-containing protein [Oscillospiraceae bacterium]|jgi:predicted nucleotidyltransferase|nr:nucleotidyltransferase domain-containing protein [Oscillospiraceae bacterium]